MTRGRDGVCASPARVSLLPRRPARICPSSLTVQGELRAHPLLGWEHSRPAIPHGTDSLSRAAESPLQTDGHLRGPTLLRRHRAS